MNKTVAALNNFFAGNVFTLVDVGACGGINARWNAFNGLIRTVGFEPDEKEFVKLHNNNHQTWFNTALADVRGKRTLHITKEQTNTSFLTPNLDLLRQFQWSPREHFDDHHIVNDIELQCDTLDAVLGGQNIHPDYLKVDTQGSELWILGGAAALLRDDFLIVEIEVEFAQIYKDQPLFADVDTFMREHGYILQDLGSFLSMKPYGLAGIGGAKGRLVAADALYFKDLGANPEILEKMSENKIVAAIAGYTAYGYPESGIQLLQQLEKCNRTIKNQAEIIRCLRTIRPLSNKIPAIKKLAEFCGKFWYNHRKTEHCFWDLPVGN